MEKIENSPIEADSANTTGTSDLKWEVFVTPGIPIVTPDRPADIQETFFQAMASTLIYGIEDAVLVDAFMTTAQASALADWVASKGKNLTTIYITHGHGDHWFGVGTLLKRFPSARVVATSDTVKVMRQNASPEMLQGAWEAGFPGQIPADLVIAEELEGNVIDLEGHDLVVVELGHTDTDDTTCLHVPSIGLVVAGDAAYNDVHLYLAESNALLRKEWIAALDKIESLNPRAVVASHKRPDRADDPGIIEETRQYIRDFDRLAETANTAQELYYGMLKLYPDRVNPGWALWGSARAVKPAAANAAEANKALVLAGITGVFIDRNPTVLDRLFSDDYRQHNPQIPNGAAAIKALLGNLPADFKYEPGLVVADGDYVTIHGRYLGWGPKPMVAVDIFRVANGKIAEHWDVMQEEVAAAQSANGNSMLTAPQA